MIEPGVDTPHDDVSTSGMVGDLVDAIKRGGVGLRDRAQQEIDRMRDAYARARMQRALNLALLVGLAYLLLKGKRR